MYLQAVARDRARRVLNDALRRWSINYREDLKMIRIRNAILARCASSCRTTPSASPLFFEAGRALCDRADDPIAALVGQLVRGARAYVREVEMARRTGGVSGKVASLPTARSSPPPGLGCYGAPISRRMQRDSLTGERQALTTLPA